jgi:hypothetical protein
MRAPRFLSLILTVGLLSGCGFTDWLAEDPDDLKFSALVREEVERVEAERGRVRRDYIDQRIDKKIGSLGHKEDQFAKLDERINAMGTRVDVVARRAGTSELALSIDRPSGPTPEEFQELRSEAKAAIRVVAELIDDADQRGAAANARFERLEYRTRTVEWPAQQPGTGPGLHLASYKTHESALRGWEVLLKKYPSVLRGHEPALTEIETVAGRFVRLIVGTGLPETSMIRIRNQVRAGGDYAMIMPVPVHKASSKRSGGVKPAPGS